MFWLAKKNIYEKAITGINERKLAGIKKEKITNEQKKTIIYEVCDNMALVWFL